MEEFFFFFLIQKLKIIYLKNISLKIITSLKVSVWYNRSDLFIKKVN